MTAETTRRDHWVAFVLLTVGIMVLLAGLWPHPGQVVLGHPLGEAYGHVWMQWLLERAVRSGSAFFGATDVVLLEPIWVMPTDPLTRLASLPVSLALGRVVAHNVAVAVLLALGAGGLAVVARRLGAPPVSAAIGALFFIWSPALLGFAADGRVDSLGICWLPLLTLAWMRVVERPTLRRGLLLGLVAAAVPLAGLNHAIVALIAGLLPTGFVMVRDRSCVRPLLVGAIGGALSAGLIVALLLHVEGNDPGRLEQLSNPEGRSVLSFMTAADIQDRHLADLWVGAARLHQSADAFSWWMMPEAVTELGHTRLATKRLTVQSYAPGGFWRLPVIAWMVALIGLARQPRAIAPLLGGAALAHVLSLGYGFTHTLPFSWDQTFVYLAPAVLWDSVPVLGRFNNYGLFGAVAAMALGVAVARTLSGLPRPRTIGALVLAAWTVEVMAGPVPLPIDTSRATLPAPMLDTLQSVDPDRGVVVFPMSRDVSFLLQSWHEKPSLLRFRLKAKTKPKVKHGSGMLADPTGTATHLAQVAMGKQGPKERDVERLGKADVGAVVSLPHLVPEGSNAPYHQRLQSLLGPPTWAGEQGTVWLIPRVEHGNR